MPEDLLDNPLLQYRGDDNQFGPEAAGCVRRQLAEGGCSVHRFHRQFADRQAVLSTTALDQADRTVD